MKNLSSIVSFFLLLSVGSVGGAPALVWRQESASSSSSSSSTTAVHSSDSISPFSVLNTVLPEEKTHKSVVFFLSRNEDGTESLTSLADSGSLPAISSKYESADCYHSVQNMANTFTVAKEATKARPQHNVVELSLEEYLMLRASKQEELEVSHTGTTIGTESNANTIMTKTQAKTKKRARKIQEANVFVVRVDNTQKNAAMIDTAVTNAIHDQDLHSVILAAARSVAEVKHERDSEMRQMYLAQQQAGAKAMQNKNNNKRKRRRLEEDADQQNADNAQEDQEDDFTGLYYVHMTPNILAGILFFLLFTVIAYIGVSCMNMIQGQDVYVTKMPIIGREA